MKNPKNNFPAFSTRKILFRWKAKIIFFCIIFHYSKSSNLCFSSNQKNSRKSLEFEAEMFEELFKFLPHFLRVSIFLLLLELYWKIQWAIIDDSSCCSFNCTKFNCVDFFGKLNLILSFSTFKASTASQTLFSRRAFNFKSLF